ncbi:MAG TPA: Na-translocating system protein MpsC family protein [Solirubrobacterales bacterium]|nr:Na-translocating system protein MpsC family protein [Solirubrobacterales bacterium]
MSDERSEPGKERLSGGELNAAVTREVVRIHTAAIGRGPRKSYSFHNGNTLVTVLLEVLTRAEQNLLAYEEGEAVLAMRRLSQRAMAEELKAAVARLTGREVIALMSDNHLDPDMAVQVFVLDAPLT